MRLRLTAGTIARAAGIAAITLLAAGCSATTRTRPFVLALDPATPRGARSLAVASATQAQDAARLYTVGVVEWGRFDEQDLANIGRSLADTIALHAPAGTDAAAAPLEIHLHVRRYLIAVSNTAGGALACVAWAMVDEDGQVRYSSQFYAAAAVEYFGTLGGVKNHVHEAIIRRIATTALHVSADPAEPLPIEFEGSYPLLSDAIDTLPRQFVSRGDAAGMAQRDPGALFMVTAAESIPWEAAEPPAEFDWGAYLEPRRAAGARGSQGQ